jgi:hypothetical protein
MSGKRATLAEIMGKKGASIAQGRDLSMDDLPELLGEGMPKLQFGPVGRVRLIRALKQRFGAGFRDVPGVSGIMKDFDQGVSFEGQVRKMKSIKAKG